MARQGRDDDLDSIVDFRSSTIIRGLCCFTF